jgi:hypothetical protein
MDQEERSLLDENLRVSRENHQLLLKVRSVQRWSSVTRILYWVILIGISFGAFYFLQPYIERIMKIYSYLPN